MSQLSIQGASPGPYYVVDTSSRVPIATGTFSTLREAQRSLLNTAGALAFDAGATFATVQPAPGTP